MHTKLQSRCRTDSCSQGSFGVNSTLPVSYELVVAPHNPADVPPIRVRSIPLVLFQLTLPATYEPSVLRLDPPPSRRFVVSTFNWFRFNYCCQQCMSQPSSGLTSRRPADSWLSTFNGFHFNYRCQQRTGQQSSGLIHRRPAADSWSPRSTGLDYRCSQLLLTLWFFSTTPRRPTDLLY